jgi:hypothetical protein
MKNGWRIQEQNIERRAKALQLELEIVFKQIPVITLSNSLALAGSDNRSCQRRQRTERIEREMKFLGNFYVERSLAYQTLVIVYEKTIVLTIIDVERCESEVTCPLKVHFKISSYGKLLLTGMASPLRCLSIARKTALTSKPRFFSTSFVVRNDVAPNLGTHPVQKKPIGGFRGGSAVLYGFCMVH